MERAAAYFRELQDRIVAALSRLDGSRFREDEWQRPGGGGGRSRVLENGNVFEKAGVNYSDVHGELRPDFARGLPGDGLRFRATGVSLVLHPRNPHIPTVHANFRRLERGAGAGMAGWFGGGADLTPYYVYDDDAVHFHRTFKRACDAHHTSFFPRFKDWCDEYFYLPHRREPRGVGGIFFDYLGAGGEVTAGRQLSSPPPADLDGERLFAFVKAAGDAFLPAYLPIAERHVAHPYTEAERAWQLVRRGRYVEFNLIYDRGTIFGLKTDGRTESILMSLPSQVAWVYDHHPAPGSAEAISLEKIVAAKNWADSETATAAP